MLVTDGRGSRRVVAFEQGGRLRLLEHRLRGKLVVFTQQRGHVNPVALEFAASIQRDPTPGRGRM
jgi:hypothetical protein